MTPEPLAPHVLAVLGVEPAQQERLLGQAEANDWTPQELKAEAVKVKRSAAGPVRPGRPRLPAFVKTVNRWERELADESAFAELDLVAELDSDEAGRLTTAVEGMLARCEGLLEALRAKG